MLQMAEPFPTPIINKEKELQLKSMFLISEIDSKSVSNQFYHYTNAANLLNILKKDKVTLRFSDYRYMNDITEGKAAEKALQRACNNLFEKGEISEKYKNFIYNLKPLPKMIFFKKRKIKSKRI